MSEAEHVPTYSVRVESSVEGFHAVVSREGMAVYQGAPRAERAAARWDASLFVVRTPEERRIVRWDDEEVEPGLVEKYHQAVRRGGDAVGWVTLQNPLAGAYCVYGTFHPGPACEPFLPLFQVAVELSRRLLERWESPKDWQLDDPLFEEWQTAVDAITALGLTIGDPPRRVGGVNLFQDWRIELYPVGEGF